ncbi:MAG: hypothetical protein JWM40_1914 [Frankiales bacterium]|nr:hypothetical protein [Frankiales bacterium]
MTNSQRGYTITRIMDAPRALVWRCWTDPAQFAIWFGGHHGQMKDMVTEPVVGGAWGGTMVLPDGHEMTWVGRFLAVDEPEHLVLAISDEPLVEESLETYTVRLTDLGEKTEMEVRQSGGNLSDEEYLRAKAGTESFLDVMAEVLAGSA